MHLSSLENMTKCYERYLDDPFLDGGEHVKVLDIGGADVNGSYRAVFVDPRIRYVTADLAPGAGVDIVLHDPYRVPARDGEFDVVISGQMFEHCEFFWLAFQEMVRVVKDDGLIFLIAPSSGPIHRYPVDCYRFYPDSYSALARYAGCHLESCWLDERGPWYDLVGVFRKRPLIAKPREGPMSIRRKRSALPALAVAAPADPANGFIPPGSPEEEATSGAENYLTTLARIHGTLRPGLYLEIGVRDGDSLRLARARAIGIDPTLRLDPAASTATLYEETSDEFFERHAGEGISAPIDLAFIDGLHLFEYALRDFMNIEKRASRCGVIVVDDIFPNCAAQGSRHRRTRAWTGDVWRLTRCLRNARPDLILLPLDCAPSGFLLVAGLDPSNRVLWDQYNPLVRQYLSEFADGPPPAIIGRAGALQPGHPLVSDLLNGLGKLAQSGAATECACSFVSEFRKGYGNRDANSYPWGRD
jgi:hypothetical protein